MIINPYEFTTIAFSYANAGGSGDRTATITMGGSISPSSGTLLNLVDGAFGANSTDSMRFPLGQTNKTITFTFPSPVQINQFKFYNSTATSQGNARVKADGVTVTADFTFADTFTVNATSTPSATVYTIEFDGATNGSPWFEEAEFRIRPG